MTRAAALLALLAAPAAADSQRVWLGLGNNPSTMTLHEPTDPAAVATLTFVNTQVHGGDEVIPLTWGEIDVTVRFEWNASRFGAERIEVIPPDGYIAIPPVLDVDEDTTGVVHIVLYQGG